jgi:hypothetical protein
MATYLWLYWRYIGLTAAVFVVLTGVFVVLCRSLGTSSSARVAARPASTNAGASV